MTAIKLVITKHEEPRLKPRFPPFRFTVGNLFHPRASPWSSLAKHKAFTAIALVYVLSVLVIFPFSEYAVNDDWDFITHVRNFSRLDFTKNSLIDSSFVLQGLVGVAWTKLFGLSYPALKVLTVLATVCFLFSVDQVLKLHGKTDFIRFSTLALALFNPFIYPFSFTFMTEPYFLLCLALSYYYLTSYKYKPAPGKLLLAVTFAAASILIRQLGLLLAPAVLLSIGYLDYKRRACYTKHLVISLALIITTAAISFLWPQYNSNNELAMQGLVAQLANPIQLLASIGQLPYVLPYFAFSVLPLAVMVFLLCRPALKILIAAGTAFLFTAFYSVNIFKLGNVLYPEGLLLKNNYLDRLSLFDNIAFKALLCLFVVASMISLAIFFAGKKRLELTNVLPEILLLMALTIPIILYGRFFDRYFVNGLFFFVIITATLLPNKLPIGIKIAGTTSLVFYCLYIFVLAYDFHTYTAIQWAKARTLKQERNLDNELFLSDTYSKYISVYFKPNGPQVDRSMPIGLTYTCYIQRDYTTTGQTIIQQVLSRIETSKTVNVYLANPVIYDAKLTAGFRPPTHDTTKIVNKTPYFSVQDWILGNKAFVVTYCTLR